MRSLLHDSIMRTARGRAVATTAAALAMACSPSGEGASVARRPPPPTATAGARSARAADTANTAAAADPNTVTVYRSPTCGCCKSWAEHMRRNGFRVTEVEQEDLSDVKAAGGVPATAQSCHTALVGGYVVEGHVPAADVRRLLVERPDGVVGIAAPGMPVGAPGMETPGTPADRDDVVAFRRDGSTRQFASH